MEKIRSFVCALLNVNTMYIYMSQLFVNKTHFMEYQRNVGQLYLRVTLAVCIHYSVMRDKTKGCDLKCAFFLVAS